MNKYDYNLEIKQCEQLLQNNKINEAFIELQNLYKIKPVRLDWYIVNAKYQWVTSGIPSFKYLADVSWALFLYPGISKLSELSINMIKSYQDIPDIQRHKLFLINLDENRNDKDNNWLLQMSERFQLAKVDFIKNPESEENARQLYDLYFSFQNNILLFLLNAYMQSKNMVIPEGREWFLEFPNGGFLKENLMEKTKAPFILIEDESSDGLDEKITIYILQYFQKIVYHIKTPLVFEVEQKIELKDTVAVSMNTMEKTGNVYTLYPVVIRCRGEILGDNREYVIDYLVKNNIRELHAVVLTSGVLMDNFCSQSVLKKTFDRLYGFVSKPLESQMVFGWAGDYLSYISQIHNIDVCRLLNSPTECSYSIIVPARNSARTLRYTLMTCLNQRYAGNYEIVLSDNSTPGNTEVYQLYKEVNDPRIKYYRTPREYNLSRSFEFAFLHTKGEFLLSLGSDDALLPWALEVLDDLRKEYPNENVIQWERGFYAWPGFNGGQQNQFIIPRDYQKGDFHPEYRRREYYFASIFNNSDHMYLLPNLYLNSGCKRDYLKTILSKTGRLFDGICQDIYMGVVNAAINDKILNIPYPLMIAGMADGSMGAKANLIYKLNDEETGFLNDLKKTANIGGYCASVYERLMPEVTTDKSSLYNCILRMIARGVIAESDLEHFDFQKWFLDVFSQMDIRDPFYDKKIHYFRYTASLHGEEFLKWFDETIYHKALEPRFIDEDKLAKLHEKTLFRGDRSIWRPHIGCF